MEIKYLGHSSFQIKTKNASIVTDPFDPATVGLKYPKVDADILTISHHHADHDKADQVGGNKLVIDWPGEYEKNAVRMFGYGSFHDKQSGAERGENVLFKFEVEGITILHCGDQGFVPPDTFIDDIGEVDIMLVPVGGHYTIDSAEAIQFIKKVDPSLVIPMHYNHAALNQEVFANLEPVDTFLTKMGITSQEPLEKLIVKQEDLQPESLKVVVLSISP
jgi:L-ascorbate metabolism protein UlaG (beta-lactamase superfamily)